MDITWIESEPIKTPPPVEETHIINIQIVKDLDTAPIGVPDPDDWGFYVESTDNIVHKAKMSDIAKTFPSVHSVSYNGGSQKETGDINITKTQLS